MNKGKVWGEMEDGEVKGANKEQMELFFRLPVINCKSQIDSGWLEIDRFMQEIKLILELVSGWVEFTPIDV